MADNSVPLGSLPDWLMQMQQAGGYVPLASAAQPEGPSPLASLMSPEMSLSQTPGPSRLEALKDFLTPEWSKPFAGMSPEQANKEAQILSNPDVNAPGKIGPGYLSDSSRLAVAATDAASWLAPELKGLAALKGMAGLVPKAARVAGETAAEVAPSGIQAYHASPHDFDKFDITKIGTGEGAQAYGHGIYAAESPAVSGRGGTYDRAFTEKLMGELKTYPEVLAATFVQRYGTEAEAAKAIAREADKDVGRQFAGTDQDYRKAIDLLNSGWKSPKAKIYQVSIKADPEHFLDWDKPLSEQSEHVRSGLKALGFDLEKYNQDDLGQHAVGMLGSGDFGNVSRYPDHEKAAAALRSAGIPGIKYLDQGSRAAPNQVQLARELDLHQQILADAQQSGDPRRIADAQSKIKTIQERMAPSKPTSNYVVFDDKMVDILKKYGLAGLAALPAIQAAQQRQAVPLSSLAQ